MKNTGAETSAASAHLVPDIWVPPEIFDIAAQTIGAFFEPISKFERCASAKDFLDLSKSCKRAEILGRYTTLESKKLLEIGSGFGTNLAVWIKEFGIDAHGVEPGGTGFDQAFFASRRLLVANGIDPDRVINGTGEALPFADQSFDLVYSANVLEHTSEPERVVAEAVRVLRPGGLLHIEIPNYLSYFEGHYFVVMPPILFNGMLASWVRFVFRRDPAFARTLRTRINPVWCRRIVKSLGRSYPLELISVGEELFLERLQQPFNFETIATEKRIGRLIQLVQRMNIGNWIGRLIVRAQGHYPIYLTVRRTSGI